MAADASSLASLLPLAFSPVVPRRERVATYRQWRLLKGEYEKGDDNDVTPRQGLTPQDFEIDYMLGEGNYSQVVAATLKSTQMRVALKIIDKAKCKRYKKEDEVLVERWVLRNMRHPSIIEMYHAFQEMSALYLSLEMMPGGELWSLTHRCGLPQATASFYAAQMLEVLQFLHERDIVHRDVKPENVLLTGDAHVKVIDFGTAKLLRNPIKLGQHDGEDNKRDRRGKFKEFVGTPEYMAPEAINNKFCTQRADLWSFGAFIAQIVTGHPCFKGGSDYLTFKRVLARKYQLFEGTPPVAADLIAKLCMLEPTERLGGTWPAESDAVDPATLTADAPPRDLGHAALREHPFFAGLPAQDLPSTPCRGRVTRRWRSTTWCGASAPRASTRSLARRRRRARRTSRTGPTRTSSRWPSRWRSGSCSRPSCATSWAWARRRRRLSTTSPRRWAAAAATTATRRRRRARRWTTRSRRPRARSSEMTSHTATL